jgi:3-oxoacyl-[acyl-carrier-protein] synthase II
MVKPAEPNPPELESALRALAAETLSVEPSKLTPSTRFSDIAADSLALVELAMSIEDAYAIELTKADYNGFVTLSDAIACVAEKLSRGSQLPAGASRAEPPTSTAGDATPDAQRGPGKAPAVLRARRPASQRVVISGLGAVTPVGLDAPSSFAALLRGVSGVDTVSFPLHEEFGVRIGAEAKGFDPHRSLGVKDTRRHARYTHLACAAASEAVRDSGIKEAGYEPERIGVLLGVGMGGVELFFAAAEALVKEGPRRVSPFALPALVPNMAPGLIARLMGFKGPSYSVASACASSAHAIGNAVDLLRAGRVDAVLAGGSEAAVTPLAMAGFARMAALSIRNHAPQQASRPFDADRDGFVMGEGAGVLVLETLENARARGAKIYAELAGTGATSDAFHETQPDAEGKGAETAMRYALEDAGLAPEQIGYVNAHATSTPVGDRIEAIALRNLFGAHTKRLYVSSTKSMTGHLLGAAGAVEAIVTTLALVQGKVPPTINLDKLDPAIDLDCVPHEARTAQMEAALSNNFGFGGQNAALVIRRLE